MKATTRILVPTDFSVRSLNLLKSAFENYEFKNGQRVEVILICGYNPGDSIQNLLFFSKKHLISRLQRPEFNQACKLIKSRYESLIDSISIELLSSSNANYIKNYLESRNFPTVLAPKNFNWKFPEKSCFDVGEDLLKYSKRTILLDWDDSAHQSTSTDVNSMAELFLQPVTLNTANS